MCGGEIHPQGKGGLVNLETPLNRVELEGRSTTACTCWMVLLGADVTTTSEGLEGILRSAVSRGLRARASTSRCRLCPPTSETDLASETSLERISIHLGECWGLVAKLLKILKGPTMGSHRGSLDPAAYRGVAHHPAAIFRKSPTLEPRCVRAVSSRIRDTTLGLDGTKGRGGPGKGQANSQNTCLP